MKKVAVTAQEKIGQQLKEAAAPNENTGEKDSPERAPAGQIRDLTETTLRGGTRTIYTGGKKLVRTIRYSGRQPSTDPKEPPEEKGPAPKGGAADNALKPKEAEDPQHTHKEAPHRAQNNPKEMSARGNSGEIRRKSTEMPQGKRSVPQPRQKGDYWDMIQPGGDGLQSNARKTAGIKEHRARLPKGVTGSAPKEAGSRAQRIKTPARAAAQAKAAQKSAVQAAARAREFAQRAMKRTARGARKAAKAVGSAVKGFFAALKTLVAFLIAGGSLALVVILLICLIAFVTGSAFGIFFGAEPTGYGTPIKEVASALNEEFYGEIQKTIDEVEHDALEFDASDGVTAIRWEDVFAVFAASVTGGVDGTEAVTMDAEKTATLRRILWNMNEVRHTTETVSKEVEVPIENEDGEIELEKQIITETTLTIHILHKTPAEMAVVYGFNARQNEAVALLAEPEYASLWAKLLGGFTNGGGEIITPDTDWMGTNIFAWPLPQSFSITSRFGYRTDPFTGKMSYHSGTDIAAPYGTPILASAGGTVTIANGTDPWGGSYGYYVKISHNSTYDTLYAHCSSICVTAGQQVAQGQVIGYVGSTGNSTGNHLHFEIWAGGERSDALDYFL